MEFEFQLNSQLQGMTNKSKENIETMKQSGKEDKKFESSGNDIIGSGIGLDKFNPKIN